MQAYRIAGYVRTVATVFANAPTANAWKALNRAGFIRDWVVLTGTSGSNNHSFSCSNTVYCETHPDKNHQKAAQHFLSTIFVERNHGGGDEELV